MLNKYNANANSIRSVYKVITIMVIRPLDDPTLCAQSVVADLQLLGFRYVWVGDGPVR